MLLAWGPFVFEAGAASYEELRRRTGKRFPRHAIIGRKPAGQYLGPKETEITIRGTIFTLDQPGGRDAALALLDEAQANTSYLLVSGVGDVFGLFTLEEAELSESVIVTDGIPLKSQFDLKFCEDAAADGGVWSLWP